MGKKSLQKDRMYLTAKEWREEWGGSKDKAALPFSRLPFYCCALTFTPFEDPVCAPDGAVFDIVNIVPYVQKFKKHPISGEPLSLSDLVRLTFHKNTDGEYCCPVLQKVFTEHSHIVANLASGHVYSAEAVEELNMRARAWRDLITDQPFTRGDVVTLQDPKGVAARDLSSFDHVQKGLKVEEDAALSDRMKTAEFNLNMDKVSGGLRKTLEALKTDEAKEAFARGGGGRKAEALRLLTEAKVKTGKDKGGEGEGAAGGGGAGGAAAAGGAGAPDPRLQAPARQELNVSFRPGASTWNADAPSRADQRAAVSDKGDPRVSDAARRLEAARGMLRERSKFVESAYTGGLMSRAFTSTVAPSHTGGAGDRVTERVQRRPKKKGYVRVGTTHGDLNIELHCDIAPRTCENFLLLATAGYYDGSPFHRSIKSFMVQGGDPTGTGKGGESVFGPTFADETDPRLTHRERGVLSMANPGEKDRNGSQFFILYKSAHHLDHKHSVFGRVVGGMETLAAIEKIPTDDSDRPTSDVRILSVSIFVDPFKEEWEAEKKAEEDKRKKEHEKERAREDVGTWLSNPAAAANPQLHAQRAQGGSGVGRYLNLGGGAGGAGAAAAEDAAQPPAAKKAKTGGGGYGNFDKW